MRRVGQAGPVTSPSSAPAMGVEGRLSASRYVPTGGGEDTPRRVDEAHAAPATSRELVREERAWDGASGSDRPRPARRADGADDHVGRVASRVQAVSAQGVTPPPSARDEPFTHQRRGSRRRHVASPASRALPHLGRACRSAEHEDPSGRRSRLRRGRHFAAGRHRGPQVGFSEGSRFSAKHGGAAREPSEQPCTPPPVGLGIAPHAPIAPLFPVAADDEFPPARAIEVRPR